MNGIKKSKVTVTLRNPLNHNDQLSYDIIPFDNILAKDWIVALKELLTNKNQLEKNFCFLGFPNSARSLNYLCNELNSSISIINNFFSDYQITETYVPETVMINLDINHTLLNYLHNHFERLQGTVWNLSDYYRRADYNTKYAIRQLNNICHEMESLILSLRKEQLAPEWVRPSQITTFLQCQRHELTDAHRELFSGYDRHFGYVYMHWTQIGKTLFEVFRDENAPNLDNTVCEAINSLKYYSGEFDVEWGNSIYENGDFFWHDAEQKNFRAWLLKNNLDPNDKKLSIGYLPIGKVSYEQSFGTADPIKIRKILGQYLDIYKIQIDEVSGTYDYCWTDYNYKEQQINTLRVGYDYSSRGG